MWDELKAIAKMVRSPVRDEDDRLISLPEKLWFGVLVFLHMMEIEA